MCSEGARRHRPHCTRKRPGQSVLCMPLPPKRRDDSTVEPQSRLIRRAVKSRELGLQALFECLALALLETTQLAVRAPPISTHVLHTHT